MKHLRFPIYLGMTLLVLLAACAPQATPAATEAPPEAQAVEAPTETATLVTVPTEAPATPTLAPVMLAGPEMAIGSQYPYVDGTTLVAVPGGPFTMGRGGGTDNPEHQVTLPDFWIYSTKVTNQQYARCVKLGLCTGPDLQDDPNFAEYAHLNDPVVGVTYDQAAAYCAFVHGRLPTEAEWEKTARGPDANIYPWGSGAPNADLLNFNNNVGHTTNVINYQAGQSYYQALDMEGNAFEWVADWYDALYYRDASAADNPSGPPEGLKRSVRSSSYKSGPDEIPAAVRRYEFPKNHRRDLGFRCVVDGDPSSYFAPSCAQISFGGGTVAQGSNPVLTWTCPVLSVNAAPQACDSNSTYVTFNSDTPSTTQIGGVDPPGCNLLSGSPGSFPQQYDCNQPTTATIDSYCFFTGIKATCPAHYVLDESNPNQPICKWDGSGTGATECLPDQTYDPVNQCCTSTPGADASSYPLCPAGSVVGSGGPGLYWCLAGNPPSPSHADANVVMPPACPVGCVNPSQYSDQNSCQSAGCTWTIGARGGGSCTK